MTTIAVRHTTRPDFTTVVSAAARVLRRARALPRLVRFRYYVRMADIGFALASAPRSVERTPSWAASSLRMRP